MVMQYELFNDVKAIDTSQETRLCIKCGERKPAPSFVRYGSQNQTESVCKKCRRYHLDILLNLKKKYEKPDPETFQCPICKKKEFSRNMGACLDHDHKTGEFRGWICNECNSALGFFEDNLNYIRRAIPYLENHQKKIDM